MRVACYVFVAILCASAAYGKVTEGPWLLNGAPVPEQGIRITTLGSGTPDVRKDQVSSGFLLELGNGDKFIWDLGTGSYQNLLATAVPAKDLTKVGEAKPAMHSLQYAPLRPLNLDTYASHAVMLTLVPFSNSTAMAKRATMDICFK